MAEIFIEVVKFVFFAIVEILLVWTGEIVLFVLSLGRRKPRWDLYTKETVPKFVLFSDLSVLIGLVFWIAVVAYLVNR